METRCQTRAAAVECRCPTQTGVRSEKLQAFSGETWLLHEDQHFRVRHVAPSLTRHRRTLVKSATFSLTALVQPSIRYIRLRFTTRWQAAFRVKSFKAGTALDTKGRDLRPGGGQLLGSSSSKQLSLRSREG